MKLLVFLGALTVAFARPPCGNFYAENKAKMYTSLWHGVKTLKNPETYAPIKDLSEYADILPAFMALFDQIPENEKGEIEQMLKKNQNYKDVLNGAYSLVKAVLVEGAKPTEEELTNLAKKMSEALRGIETRYRYLTDTEVMTNETIETLKRLVDENPIKAEGNNFIEKFETSLPKIYPVAKRLRERIQYIKAFINKVTAPIISRSGEDVASKFYEEFFITELLELLKDEETAITIYKEFGTFFDTLKNPASYESLQALFDGFKRSERLEAHAILIREAAKCLGQSMTAEEKAEFHKYAQHYLKLLKAIFADGQGTTEDSIIEFLCEPDEHSGLYYMKLAGKIGEAFEEGENQEKLRKCVVSDKDRADFLSVLEMAKSAPVLPADTVLGLKGTNEKVYAIIRLINGAIKAVRKRQGLGAEADGFFKHTVTLRHSMLKFADYCRPSDATKTEMKAESEVCLAKFNSLSSGAKHELIEMFPYRAVIALSTLH